MSDEPRSCDRFDRWLLEGDRATVPEHFQHCVECRPQWQAHAALATTFAGEAVPELSFGFEAGLDRKLAAVVEVRPLRPLRGWRRAAMVGYVAAGLGALGWALRDVPLPAIDPSAPWLGVATFVAVPLTFLLAIGVSRWIPAPGRTRGLRSLAL